MKNTLIILSILVLGFTAKAGETKSNYYIMNTGETMNCTEISFGVNTIKAVLESGEKVSLNKSEVKALTVNGKYFEKYDVYQNNKNTGKQEFMEFVATRAGLKLFKYNKLLSSFDDGKVFNSNGVSAYCYVIYKGNEFYNQITDKNYPSVFEFFGIKYTEK